MLGHDIATWQPDALRDKMAYVSQGDHIIDDSVRENLSWGIAQHPIEDDHMLDVLIKVGVIKSQDDKEVLDKPAKDLSMGQQQRLSIARMLLDESEIVILDEPLAGVDVFTMQELMPHLVNKIRRPGKTFLMFSHRLGFAAYAGHVVVLGDKGSVIEEGNPRQLLKEGNVFKQLHEAALAELSLTDLSESQKLQI